MKQTAVEWLLNEISLTTILDKEDVKLFEQAKELEKNQIANAWYSAYGGDNNYGGEQYYNETFKQL